jgi:hypothetical protein
MDHSQRKLFMSVVNENSSLKRKYAEMEEKYQGLIKSKSKFQHDLEVAETSAMNSFTRKNITSTEWHKSNPKFAEYWLGFHTWGEFIIYHQCLWPTVPVDENDSNSDISDFEQSVITKILFRKGNEFASLGWMWGRSNIGSYVRKWGPLWGVAGSDLSILDINEEILIALTPEDFKNGCTDKVCGLVDGKDFKIETIRTHSGLTRAIHSNKVNCSALRVLSYVLNNGLNIERSDAYLGRASETHIVQVLGSHIGAVPIRKADKYAYRDMISVHKKKPIPITDSAKNVGLMIASKTKKRGRSWKEMRTPKTRRKIMIFVTRLIRGYRAGWMPLRMEMRRLERKQKYTTVRTMKDWRRRSYSRDPMKAQRPS